MKNTHKGFIIPLLIIIIAVLAIGGGLYVYEKSKPTQNLISTTVSIPVTPSSVQQVTPTWNVYTNQKFGYSFKYPSDWKIGNDTQTGVMQGDQSVAVGPKSWTGIGQAPYITITHDTNDSTITAADYSVHYGADNPEGKPDGQNMMINGFQAFRAQDTNDVYTDISYIIKKNGNFVTFTMREKGPEGDFSSYLPILEQIVLSFTYTK